MIRASIFFKLQPKKPNWDLKRELDKKMDVLNARTDNAIARLVRDRITGAQKAAEKSKAPETRQGDGEARDGWRGTGGRIESQRRRRRRKSGGSGKNWRRLAHNKKDNCTFNISFGDFGVKLVRCL